MPQSCKEAKFAHSVSLVFVQKERKPIQNFDVVCIHNRGGDYSLIP